MRPVPVIEKKIVTFTPSSIITSSKGQGSRFSVQCHLQVIRNLCRDKTVQIMLLRAPIKTASSSGELEKSVQIAKGRRNNCNLHSFSPFCCKCCSVLGLARPDRRGYSPRSGHVCLDNGSKLTPGPRASHLLREKMTHFILLCCLPGIFTVS